MVTAWAASVLLLPSVLIVQQDPAYRPNDDNCTKGTRWCYDSGVQPRLTSGRHMQNISTAMNAVTATSDIAITVSLSILLLRSQIVGTRYAAPTVMLLFVFETYDPGLNNSLSGWYVG